MHEGLIQCSPVVKTAVPSTEKREEKSTRATNKDCNIVALAFNLALLPSPAFLCAFLLFEACNGIVNYAGDLYEIISTLNRSYYYFSSYKVQLVLNFLVG